MAAPRRPRTQPLDTTGLTERQRRILEVIRDSVSLRGYPPSIREIGTAAGLHSSSSVAYQLKELEKKGFIRRSPNKPRAVDIRHLGQSDTLATSRNTTGTAPQPTPTTTGGKALPEEITAAASYIPLVGTIAAGVPITAEESIEEYLPLPERLVGSGELFMLEVQGDSMINAGILPGDYVIVERRSTAEHGDIVAALIDGEATVKTLHRDEKGLWLQPENDNYGIIEVDELDILGVITAVFRAY
ncbi:MAG: transcriptional repressor LexA [Corynebacterium sp.]|nr:transcriptional repressor LexA [Corynebacterium sp.]